MGNREGRKDFLLEVGCEEVPARFMETGLAQLKARTKEWFEKKRIPFSSIHVMGTPRRLSVMVSGAREYQEDIHEEVKGPSIKVAKTEDGNWSKQAIGFARKHGLEVNHLKEKEVKGQKHVFACTHQVGESTYSMVMESFHTVLDHIQFPKSMRFRSNFRFIRPVRWILCLYGAKEVPIKWMGLKASKWSFGHRFLGGEVVVPSADHYVEILKEEYVIVDDQKRKGLIKKQLEALARQQNWVIPIDSDLLDEVTHLVEFPTVLFGQFEEAFLSLPKEVLITTMKEHQRYFPVMDTENKLLPFFVTVRNGDSRSLEKIAKGNEKVLRARLLDAQFFFEEDIKLSIDQANEKLSSILFLQGMGSMKDKSDRLVTLAERILVELDVNEEIKQNLARAAKICKFSLTTQMVNEYPELEGVMGKTYAIYKNEVSKVCDILYDYHFPRFSGDSLPQTVEGKLLSLIDKMDTIVCSFLKGIKPTSSQDPFGLRRKGNGVVRMLMQDPIISLEKMIRLGIAFAPANDTQTESVEEILSFFRTRIRVLLQEEELRYDVIEAVLMQGASDPYWSYKKANVLMECLTKESFKKEVEAFSRVHNLGKKATGVGLDRDKLTESSEHALLRVYDEARTKYEIAKENMDGLAMFQALTHMVPEIGLFFDRVMVMVEDEAIRTNRLALMREISSLISDFASFEKIVFSKGGDLD